MDTFYSTLGLHITYDLAMHGIASVFSFGAGWRHAYGDITPEINRTFANNGVNNFKVSGNPIVEDNLVLEAGIDVTIIPKTIIGLTL